MKNETVQKEQCNHHYIKEYIKGMHTGDYVCIYCGDSCWGKPKDKNNTE